MAADIFFKIDGISGEAHDLQHEGEIEVTDWRWKIYQQSNMMAGSGGGAPKATVEDLIFVHEIDRASPNLMTACLSGRHIAKAVLTMRKSGGLPLEFFKITLSDVVITQVEPFANGGGAFEKVHLSFAKIKQEYLMQSASGGSAGAVTGAFDIKNNQMA